jgi:hypothetical protein
VVSTSATISEEIDKLLVTADRTASKINQEIAGTGNGADKSLFDKDLNDEPAKSVNEIGDDFDSLWFDVDKTGSKLNLLGYITSFGKYRPYETGKLYPVTSVTDAQKELAQYYTFRRDTIAQKEKMLLVMTIISRSASCPIDHECGRRSTH